MASEPKNLNQENIIRKVFNNVDNSLRISGTISVPAPVGGATEAKQDDQITVLNSIDSKIGSLLRTFQTSTLIDVSSTNIPGNASLPLQLIASTSDITREIQVIEDIGEYMALYTGASGAEVLLCALPLGGGTVKVEVPASTRISIKSLKATAISSASNLIINLITTT